MTIVSHLVQTAVAGLQHRVRRCNAADADRATARTDSRVADAVAVRCGLSRRPDRHPRVRVTLRLALLLSTRESDHVADEAGLSA